MLLNLACVCVYIQVYGARPIRRWLEKESHDRASKMLIREEIDENSMVYIDSNGDELVYMVEKNGGLVNEMGQKSEVLIQIPNKTKSSYASQAIKKIKIVEIQDDEDEVMEN
ncbi:hypothetical protein ACFE04_026833 [Oxalis oulophora]